MPVEPRPTIPAVTAPRFLAFCNFLRKQPVHPPVGLNPNNYADHLSVLVVSVAPHPGFELGHCWYNCLDHQVSLGGQAIYGWSLWQYGDLFVAQHHAVWKNELGQYLDPTPNQSATTTSLFMPDNRAPFDILKLRMPANLEWQSDTQFTWFAGAFEKQEYFVPGMMLTADLKDRVERLRRAC